jgi:hypothetical protein
MAKNRYDPHEAPTVAPQRQLDVDRELEIFVRAVDIPKSAPTGIVVEPEPRVLPSSIPVLVAREEDVSDVVTLPTESFLLGFIDGERDIHAVATASGLPADLVMVTVSDLARSGVVALRDE